MINPDILIHNLVNKGYHIVDDFLPFHDYQALRDQAIVRHRAGAFRQSKIGLKLEAQQNELIRTDNILWLDEVEEEPAVQVYLQQIEQLAQWINQTLYLGLFEFETHFAAYNPGTFYKLHVDQFAANNDRKISCVYYLNNEWPKAFGGELKLYSTEKQLLETISPEGNRFICFNSELPHEVCQTQNTRYSIAGWLKTRQIERWL